MRILLLLLLSISSFAQIQGIVGAAGNGSGNIDAQDLADDFETRVVADGGTYDESCLVTTITNLNSVDFWHDPTFLFTGNGFKTSKLYAIKPGDGSGDLVFSRGGAAVQQNSTDAYASAATNVPRIDYTTDCSSLFLEPSRSNLLLRSQEFQTTWVNVNTTESTDAIAAPDGTTTADRIIETTASGAHGMRQDITKAASTLIYTASCYFKADQRTWARITISDGGANAVACFFNLTGVKGSAEPFGTGFILKDYQILDVGNGWYYCRVTALSNTSTTLRVTLLLATGDLVDTYTGNASNGLYMWGAKVTQTDAFEDSYVATTTTAVSRSADAITSKSFTIPSSGTLYAHVRGFTDDTNKVFSVSDNTANNLIQIGFNSDNEIFGKVVSGGVTQALIETDYFFTDIEYKIALTYTANDIELFVNGVSIGTDVSATIPSCSQLDLSLFGRIHTLGLSPTVANGLTLTDMPALDEFFDFTTRIPPTRNAGSPILLNNDPFDNTCPAGIEPRPSDADEFLFYRGEFTGNTSVAAQISVFEGDFTDAYTLSNRQLVLSPTALTDDRNGVRFGCSVTHPTNGQIWYYYVGIDASFNWRIFRATSTDGISFTKQGMVLDFNGTDEKSISDPSIVVVETSPGVFTWYGIYTVWDGVGVPLPNNNPGSSTLGIKTMSSTDGITWTKTNITAVALGNSGSFDDEHAEGGQLLKIGDKAVILYNGNDGNDWHIGMASRDWDDVLTGAFTKHAPIYYEASAGEDVVAVPWYYDFPAGQVMYYQANTIADPDEIDIGVADLNVVEQ